MKMYGNVPVNVNFFAVIHLKRSGWLREHLPSVGHASQRFVACGIDLKRIKLLENELSLCDRELGDES